jgi:hypothetical protein
MGLKTLDLIIFYPGCEALQKYIIGYMTLREYDIWLKILYQYISKNIWNSPNSIGMRIYEIFCQVDLVRKYRLAQPILQVGPISESKNTINT